jgi:hypothetical protein
MATTERCSSQACNIFNRVAGAIIMFCSGVAIAAYLFLCHGALSGELNGFTILFWMPVACLFVASGTLGFRMLCGKAPYSVIR